VLTWVLVFIGGCGFFIYSVAWKSPEHYIVADNKASFTDSITPSREYPKLSNHVRPYIIRSQNRYTIFGSAHTRDPEYFEIGLIEEEWKKLNPTVALVEGNLGFLMPGMNPVKNLGEGGKVKALANKDNVPLYNWDLSKETLAAQLMGRFTAEQIALSQILNPYFGQMRFGKPSNPDRFIEKSISRAKFVGLEDSIKTADDVNRIWKKYFTDKNWQDIDDQYVLPGFLNEIALFNGDLRNRQLVKAIKELLDKGERVFVTCGSAHAVLVAPAFKDGTVADRKEFIPVLWNNADELNNIAWAYYENNTSPQDLNQAITWVKHSIELKSTYENNDTYAWLLYKTGLKKEAQEQALKAIEIAKAANKNYSETEKLVKLLKEKN
jgi:protein-tyrosine phosphatase